MNKTLTYSLIGLGVIVAGYFGYKKFFPKAEVAAEETGTAKSSGGGSMGTLPTSETATATITTPVANKPVFIQRPFIQSVSPMSVRPVPVISRPVIPVVSKPGTFTITPTVAATRN